MTTVDDIVAWCANPTPIGTARPDEAPDDLWRCLTHAWAGDLERRKAAHAAEWPDLDVLPRTSKRPAPRGKAREVGV